MEALLKKTQYSKTLCFLDLEGTQFSHEMIALGAVKVILRKDGTFKRICKGYYSLVKPKNRIGKVVTDLTGITDNDVKKDGKPFRVVIEELKKYLGKEFNKCLFVIYGNHDMRILAQSLAHNLDVKNDDVHIMIKHCFDFLDFASTYVKSPENNAYSLSNMLKVFNVEFKGQQHNALADALNLAYLYEAFIKNKEILKNEYKKVIFHERHFPEPVSKLLQELSEGKNVSPEDFDLFVKESIK